MRSVELAKVAVSAEALRLRRLARRQSRRAAFGAAAAVFVLAALFGLHVLLWVALLNAMTPVLATLVVLGVDVALAAILGIMALRSAPGSVEEEALEIRNQATAELRRSLTAVGIASQAAGLFIRTRVQSTARRGAMSVAAGLASRLLGR